MPEINNLIDKKAASIYKDIRRFSDRDLTEKEFREPVERILLDFAEVVEINLRPRDEYTLVEAGRADTVYNRLIIEYKRPGSLRNDNSTTNNLHSIKQIKEYIESISQEHRQKITRLAGVVFDGRWLIFVSHVNEAWHVEDPSPFTERNLIRLLKLLVKTSTGVALIPENLIEDFKGLQAERAAIAFYNALEGKNAADDLTGRLFRQWQTFFGEVTGYEEGSARLKEKKELRVFARDMGIRPDKADPPRLFFSIHTYFAVLIKLIAWLTLSRYLPKAGPSFVALRDLTDEGLREKLTEMERGGVFRKFGIRNFLEADFFGWYLKSWNKEIARQLKNVISTLAEYDPETLEVSPEQTRDLLKKLYHYLMPRDLRHDLGEYYTPDWLADRLLQQLNNTLFQPLETPKSRRETLAYARRELLKLRFLDPTCGSGTFLVLIINRIRQLGRLLNIPDVEILKALQLNVVGIDLNPLATIAARTNYLLAMGELLTLPNHGTITIPIYLADSIVPPGPGRTLEDAGTFPIPTTAGRFRVPEVFGERQRLDMLTDMLDESVSKEISLEDFLKSIRTKINLSAEMWDNTERPLAKLYKDLLTLHQHGLDGVWARIIRNAFAPNFIREFDFIVGNPPWVVWQNLPPAYREETAQLWEQYELFERGGGNTRQVSERVQVDIAILAFHGCISRYLKKSGRIGFVMPQTILKSEEAGRGFRKFRLASGEPIGVLHVDDMTTLQPFEGATNRTCVIVAERGYLAKGAIPYSYWKKTAHGERIGFDLSLSDVLERTEVKRWVAQPVNPKDPTSPWMTGRPAAIRSISACIGPSQYYEISRKGSDTRGANGVFWLHVLGKTADKKLIVKNEIEDARKEVDELQAEIEDDLVYPLLRGREVARWHAEGNLHILIPHLLPNPTNPIPQAVLEARYPKTFSHYIQKMEKPLRSRPKFRNFDPAEPEYYGLYNVGTYSFAPYKVVWREQSSFITAAVVGLQERKPVIPDHKLMSAPFENEQEAHFLCACINSAISAFIIKSYAIETSISTHILNYVAIPVFEPKNELHKRLATLSRKAHILASDIYSEGISKPAQDKVSGKMDEVEEEIDECAAKLWGLKRVDLTEIKKSLDELGER